MRYYATFSPRIKVKRLRKWPHEISHPTPTQTIALMSENETIYCNEPIFNFTDKTIFLNSNTLLVEFILTFYVIMKLDSLSYTCAYNLLKIFKRALPENN